MTSAPVGNSGLEVAPLALGGNVFGWTADEATSFAHARRVRRCRRDDDRHRRRLFGLGAGPSGGESESGDRPLAEARPGQARQGRDRDQGRLHAPGLAPDVDRRRPATPRWSGSGSTRSTFITSIRTMRACRWPTASARSTSCAAAGKIRAIGLSQFQPGAGRGGAAASPDATASPGRSRSRPGTIWSSATNLEGPLRDVAHGHGLGILPFYSLANGFLTGKYRSKDDLGKSRPRPAQRRISRRPRACGAGRARRGRGGNRRRAGDASRWPGPRPSPASPRRSPARPASSRCTN